MLYKIFKIILILFPLFCFSCYDQDIRTIEYVLEGSSTNTGHIVYTDNNGENKHLMNVSLPWSYKIETELHNNTLYVIAFYPDSNYTSITVKLFVDGKLTKSNVNDSGMICVSKRLN